MPLYLSRIEYAATAAAVIIISIFGVKSGQEMSVIVTTSSFLMEVFPLRITSSPKLHQVFPKYYHRYMQSSSIDLYR